jgi:hypothetical protein
MEITMDIRVKEVMSTSWYHRHVLLFFLDLKLSNWHSTANSENNGTPVGDAW